MRVSEPVQALLAGVPVSAVMAAPVITARPADELQTAARSMVERKVLADGAHRSRRGGRRP